MENQSPPSQPEIKEIIGDTLLNDLLKERQSERRWRLFRRAGLSIITALMVVGMYFQQSSLLSGPSLPSKEVVGVINVTGEIGPGKTASADRLIPVLARAFDAKNVQAIYLNINSQGGSPVESERINAFIDAKRAETGKPIYAVINSIGASAAYMIAVHTDKIYAGRYSLVGSIGAIMQGWDVHKAIESRDIFQRVYASGNMKGLMNPFTPMPEGGEDKAQALVTQMGQEFAKEVTERRSDRLAKDSGVNLFSGEVWNGIESHRLGLVDEIGTLDEIVLKKHKDMEVFSFGPNPGKASILGIEMLQEALAGMVTKVLTMSSDGMVQTPILFKYQTGA